MRSVVVVGAGPAGLVAAKTLLHSSCPSTFRVTILEKADRIGGMWPTERNDSGGMLRPDMPTNQSKYTVSFSDLSWSSVHIDDKQAHLNGSLRGERSKIPMFPKAWQVGRYLSMYAEKCIPKEVINLNSEVTGAEWIRDSNRSSWRLKWTSKEKNQSLDGAQHKEEDFDYMVVATGFFAGPRIVADNINISSERQNDTPRIIHSTQLRSASDVFPDMEAHEHGEKALVVVGGGMSGVEAATALAMQLSSAQYSPCSNQRFRNTKICHVISRPFYDLAQYFPNATTSKNEGVTLGDQDESPPTFLPLDLVFYNLSRRTEAKIQPVFGKVPPEKASATHQFLQTLVGSDQSDLGTEALVHSSVQLKQPPYLGISEGYSEFVRSGAITLVYGRMLAVSGNEVVINDEDGRRVIPDVIGIVDATGFSPETSISWLPKEVLDILEYDPASVRLPFLLEENSTLHPRIPNLGFVGFYQSPYWGVMEMQARMLARNWANEGLQDHDPATNASSQDKAMRQLREDMRRGDGIPQFWMQDYVGLMEGFAADLGIERNDSGFGGRDGPVIAARYTNGTGDQQEAERAIADLHDTLRASSEEGRFTARAAFRAMQGTWQMNRTLTSALPNFPSGTFKGVARFLPRLPTDHTFDAEYLYNEEGELVTEKGYVLKANRRYVYRYREDTDKISAWFVKEDGKSVDYFFNEMDFEAPREHADRRMGKREKGYGASWVARGSHLCVKDMYDSVCSFHFRGIALKTFGIKYFVKGPSKDYVSDTWYER